MKTIKQNTTDLKYLQVVDHILRKNREIGIRPETDRQLGELVYPTNVSIISAVRNGTRHVPVKAIENLAQQFEMNMNFLFKEGTFIDYVPAPGPGDIKPKLQMVEVKEALGKKKLGFIKDYAQHFKARISTILTYQSGAIRYLRKNKNELPKEHYNFLKYQLAFLERLLLKLAERLEDVLLLKEHEILQVKNKERKKRERSIKKLDRLFTKEMGSLKNHIDLLTKVIDKLEAKAK